MLQTAAFAVGIVGLLTAIAGLAGREVGAGTRCRACGYDVATIIEELSTCPECGASLKAKRAVVTGTRQRRTGLVLAGVILLAPASAAGWFVSTVAQPVAARPSWLLASTLRLGPTSQNAGLARELQRRWRTGNLHAFGQAALVDWGLTAWTEGHPSRSYSHASVVRIAVATDAVTSSDLDQFVHQLLLDIGDDTDTGRQRVALTVASELGTGIRTRLEEALSDPELRDAAVVPLLDELRNTPSQSLVVAAIDALAHQAGGPETGPAHDRLPLSIEARRAVRYLTHHADICAPALRLALGDTDPQRRLLAAVALTAAQHRPDAGPIGKAVAPSLATNGTPGDALLAARAILRAGPAALESASAAGPGRSAQRVLREIRRAFADGMPPHLERLAGPLPWQRPNQRANLLPAVP